MKLKFLFTLLLCAATTAQATLIDFESITNSTTTESSSTRIFGDFQFFVSHGHYWDVSNTGRPSDGVSDYLLNDTSIASVLSRVDGAAFTFNSIDVSEWDFGFGFGNTLEVSANLFGGGSISTSVITDSINGFETFNFTTFNNITSLSVRNSGGRLAYDNIVVNASTVPEPSTLAIFALGMMGLASRRFKK